jgi:hypothetical protein
MPKTKKMPAKTPDPNDPIAMAYAGAKKLKPKGMSEKAFKSIFSEQMNAIIMDDINDALGSLVKKHKSMEETMKILNIPYYTKGNTPPNIQGVISVEELYEIVMDKKKCKELITRLSNKALW